MPQSVEKQLTSLLERAHTEHAEYEAAVLNGVRDEEWDLWYASWLVEHGINDLLNVDLQSSDLATLLSDLFEQYKQTDESQSWYAYTAAQLIETVA
jgi:hypothetical protein